MKKSAMDVIPAGPQPLADEELGTVAGGCGEVRDHRHRIVRDHRHRTTGVVRDHRHSGCGRKTSGFFPRPL